jgi:hypothetical protein
MGRGLSNRLRIQDIPIADKQYPGGSGHECGVHCPSPECSLESLAGGVGNRDGIWDSTIYFACTRLTIQPCSPEVKSAPKQPMREKI